MATDLFVVTHNKAVCIKQIAYFLFDHDSITKYNRGGSMNLDNCTRCEETGDVNMYPTMLLAEYVKSWLDMFKAGSVKAATLNRLLCSYNTMQEYRIATMQIKDITAIHIQAYVNELARKGYGLSTIKKQMQIVTAPLRQAAAMHLIPADPSAGVRLPNDNKLQRHTRVIEPYTEEEQRRIWNIINIREHPAVIAVGLMLETGMRAGEVLALRWDKVDIQRKRLRVEATIVNPAGKTSCEYQPSAKSKASNRIVPLTPRAIELLQRLRPLNETWVIPGRGNSWLSYNNLAKHIRQVCRAAGVEYRGAHAFRHTFATNCYYRNVDVKVLSKLLGHSDIGVTMNIYVSLRGDGFDEMYAALTS